MNNLKQLIVELKTKIDSISSILPKESILDGKVAICVQNEREFNLLMEHYESKGWKWAAGTAPLDYHFDENEPVYRYEDKFASSYAINGYAERSGYAIIPFADFAKEIGITPPVFIMKSEDRVDLYDGDDFYIAANYSGKWRLLYWDGNKPFKCRVSTLNAEVCTTPEVEKAFSTREAAEKWIEEQNKPKSIMISEESPYPMEVKSKYLIIHCKNSDNHLDNIIIKDYEIKELWEAYQSLQ